MCIYIYIYTYVYGRPKDFGRRSLGGVVQPLPTEPLQPIASKRHRFAIA